MVASLTVVEGVRGTFEERSSLSESAPSPLNSFVFFFFPWKEKGSMSEMVRALPF